MLEWQISFDWLSSRKFQTVNYKESVKTRSINNQIAVSGWKKTLVTDSIDLNFASDWLWKTAPNFRLIIERRQLKLFSTKSHKEFFVTLSWKLVFCRKTYGNDIFRNLSSIADSLIDRCYLCYLICLFYRSPCSRYWTSWESSTAHSSLREIFQRFFQQER